MDGNERFTHQHAELPHQIKKMICNLVERGQHLEATIVSCADSRVAPELIFDHGLGNLSVIRTAGNIILGSIEYAVEHLGTPLIIAIRHQNSGAIELFLEHQHDTPGAIYRIS
jgi:carbonic anhydrase